jgi:hypothetical protein
MILNASVRLHLSDLQESCRAAVQKYSILNLHDHRYTYSIFSFFQVPQVSDAVADVIYKCFLPVAAGEVKVGLSLNFLHHGKMMYNNICAITDHLEPLQPWWVGV